MLQLDHLTIIAPSLAEGIEHVRACLDIDMPYGATHAEMGTHNHRLRLGSEVYLEVIAIAPNAPPPSGPRWFGLGRQDDVRSHWAQGERLRAWVARTVDIDAVLSAHAARITALYEKLEIRDPPRVVEGPRARYFATIETPRALRRLH